MAQVYSIYDTKTHLSRIIRRVKAGHEIVISERGNPIAKVVPFKKREPFEDRIARLRSSGAILSARTRTIPKAAHRPGGLKRFLKDRQ